MIRVRPIYWESPFFCSSSTWSVIWSTISLNDILFYVFRNLFLLSFLLGSHSHFTIILILSNLLSPFCPMRKYSLVKIKVTIDFQFYSGLTGSAVVIHWKAYAFNILSVWLLRRDWHGESTQVGTSWAYSRIWKRCPV